jgi:uncharacterized membrane protein
METPQASQGTRAGMIGGLLFVLVGLTPGEVVKTAVLAAVGAGVSYGVTIGLRWITGKLKRKV